MIQKVSTKITGDKGEEIACAYLNENGYSIVNRNWKNKHEEIDIIAEKDNTLIVVEVKTRIAPVLNSPESSVTSSKQKLLIKAADAYSQLSNKNYDIRFDIITVLISENSHKIEHIQDAFYPKVK